MQTTPRLTVFDGHNDVLLSLRTGKRTFLERGAEGHIDLPRARRGAWGRLLRRLRPLRPADG
jgi:membrane dipeptidase